MSAEKRELHVDVRGWLCEIARSSVVGEIAQVYVTCCLPGIVKGWHRHRFQTDRMFCVQGTARIVTVNAEALPHPEPSRFAGPSVMMVDKESYEERVVGPLAPALATIPPGLWHAFTPCGMEPCVIINCTDREYDGTDEERLPLAAIPYNWKDISG